MGLSNLLALGLRGCSTVHPVPVTLGVVTLSITDAVIKEVAALSQRAISPGVSVLLALGAVYDIRLTLGIVTLMLAYTGRGS